MVNLLSYKIYFILIFMKVTKTTACIYQVINDMYGAKCINLSYEEIPQDLNTNIRFLDVSKNPIKRLNQSSFEKYLSLVEFKCQSCSGPKGTVLTTITTFTNLSYLELLDISDTRFTFTEGDEVQFEWPVDLRILVIDNCSLRNLNFTELSKLETLNATNNSAEYFPEFNVLAPLKWIDLRNNPIDTMTLEQLLPLCIVEFLALTFSNDSSLLQPSKYCECRSVAAWMEINAIKGTPPLNCKTNHNQICDFTTSAEMKIQRKKCSKKYKCRDDDSDRVWLIAFLAALAAALAGSVGYYLMMLFSFKIGHDITTGKEVPIGLLPDSEREAELHVEDG